MNKTSEKKKIEYYLPKTRWYEYAKNAQTLKKCLYWLDRYYKDNKKQLMNFLAQKN